MRTVPRWESAGLGRLGLSPSVAFSREARRLGPFDVIEAPDWEAASLVSTIRRPAPVVVCLHTPTVLVRRYGSTAGNRLREHVERHAAGRADAVVTYSPLLVDELRSAGWFRGRSVEHSSACIDQALLDRDPAPLTSEPIVLGIGRWEARKGFELLVEAAAFLGDHVSGVRVVLVGRDVVDRGGRRGSDVLRRLADRSGVTLELVPAVPRHEVGSWYDRARVVVIPSQFESYSMVGLEALAHGRPVVCTPGVGFGVEAAQIAADGDPVRRCRADPRALAAALRPLLTDDDYAATAASAAPGLARRMAGPQAFAAGRLALYRAVAAGRSGTDRPTGPGMS
jgi:glycosyltransferase involved in cell wall biosynthesis